MVCAPVFIFVSVDHGAQRFREVCPCQHPTVFRESVVTVVVVVLGIAVVLLVALLSAVGAGTLARLDGATWPAAFNRAATSFGTVLILAAAVTGALAPFLT